MSRTTYLEAVQQIGSMLAGAGLVVSLVTLPSRAQKIGEVDLTNENKASEQQVLPDECTGGVTHGDGFIVSEREHRKLELRFDPLPRIEQTWGSYVEADLSVKNIGKATLEIPWSTDPKITERAPDSKRSEYEAATIWIRIKDERGQEGLLKSHSYWLYRSEQHPESTLKLAPGQWVNVRLKFQLLIDDKTASFLVREGTAQIRAEWRQGKYTWEREGCNIATAYHSYSSYYEQKAEPATVMIIPSPGGSPSAQSTGNINPR